MLFSNNRSFDETDDVNDFAAREHTADIVVR